MEYILAIVIIGWLISWIFSAFSDAVDKKRAQTREYVANEVLEGLDIQQMVSDYKNKLKGIKQPSQNEVSQHTKPVQVTDVLGKCPDCKEGQLQPRKSRFGKFLGCSNYPDCRHTEADRRMDKYKEKVREHFWNDFMKAYF